MSELRKVLVGPVVSCGGGFAFDTFSTSEGLKSGFPYRRVEQANYDRKATLLGFHLARGFVMIPCETANEFRKACENLLTDPEGSGSTGPSTSSSGEPIGEAHAFQI